MKFVYPNIFQSRDDDCVPEFHSVVSYGFICQDSFQWQLWVNSIFNISFNKSFLNITRTISSLSYAIIPILILNFFLIQTCDYFLYTNYGFYLTANSLSRNSIFDTIVFSFMSKNFNLFIIQICDWFRCTKYKLYFTVNPLLAIVFGIKFDWI